MTEKRFKLLNDGETIIDNKTIPTFDTVDKQVYWVVEYRQLVKLVDLLNGLNDENEHIKNTIQEAYHNERTHIGKNTLKQLMEAIQ